jgi:hypothetical protein
MFLYPSYRVFEVDPLSMLPVDYVQYKLNLTLANSQPDVEPIWEVRYRATDLFNVTNLYEMEKIKSFISSFETNADNYNKMAAAFFTEGPLMSLYVNKKGKLVVNL